MANRTGKKSKKPLQTTLGKAACHNEKDIIDLSHIQKPINTSVFGLKQVLSLFQTATQEVQNYITYECEIMYECRMCRTIFRSLANFILHKRNYCREQFNHLDLLNNNEEISEENRLENKDLCEESRPLSSELKEPNPNLGAKKSLNPVIERLKEKQEICQLAQEILHQDLSSTEVSEETHHESMAKTKSNDLLLEEIATNNAAVFQTVLQNFPQRDTVKSEFMKSEVMEIHGILDSDEAVLGPDGKICTFETNKINRSPIIPKNNLFCTECNLKFSTKKTLTYHIKYKHNNTRLVYVCPDCKDTFANAWCVYRHLFKVHRKTPAQIKRMREQIHNSCIRKDQEPIKKKKPLETVDKPDEENQWLDNIEGDNDFQMCGGCGKRFERKAALHSHAQMCTKRIAVCNTIKENNAKKKEEELYKDLKSKATKVEKTEILKGSLKRKPYLLRTYKSNDDQGQNKDKVLVSEEGVENCDVNANCEIVENNCDNNKGVSDKQDEKCTVEKVTASLSNSEDLLSPSKKDFTASPSTENIDTEKMLNIIGITSKVEQGKNVDDKIEDKTTCQNAATDSRQDDANQNDRSHTARDFDLFCQSVAQNLLIDSLEEPAMETEDSPSKITKTVPLILRRRNNSTKCEKSSVLGDQNETNKHGELTNETKLETNKDSIDVGNIAQTSNSNVLANLSSSPFKISVKSLEDLIGVSPENHLKNLENIEIEHIVTDNEPQAQVDDNELDPFQMIDPLDAVDRNISDIIELDSSSEKQDEEYPKCPKRKRVSSFDYSECRKVSKFSKEMLLSKGQDVSFITKAAPFMDQDKLLCKSCQISYSSLSRLLWHMSAHFSWFRFQCSRCSFISFNKLDCANHAKNFHGVKKSSIESVVLPIPNWKTVLMSHDFCTLDDENYLSGKHTDEILSGNTEDDDDCEDIVIDSTDEEHKEDACEDSHWTNTLFVESKNGESDSDNNALELDIPVSPSTNIKQENIDVNDDAEDSFQIEVPQEIYTLDVLEIINGVGYEERQHYEPQIKLEADDEEDDIVGDYFSTRQANQIFIEEIKPTDETLDEMSEVVPVEEENDALFKGGSKKVTDSENKECPEKVQSQQIINIRPTRNRTRSIKTIQDDFFYDLSKVIKLNDTSVSKSNLQRQKKLSQKNKESTASHGKADNQQIRVYSKRK